MDFRARDNFKEEHRIATKKSYRKNRDKILVWCREYRADNGDKIKGWKKDWNKKNPEKARVYNVNRRARIAGNGGKLLASDVKEIVDRQCGRCAACGIKTKLEMDHILPLALGGTSDRQNFQGLCKPCNISKHAKHPIDFNRSRGLLL